MAEQSVAIIEQTPQQVVEVATIQAKLLMNIVEQTKCYQEIANKKYLQVEAWETIGAFNRTHAETQSIAPIKADDGVVIGYQAHVQLWKDGKVVGGAVMPCFFTENCCKGKEGDAKHKACMSAAQTFATSKAYRMNFSFVAILAGYEPTPAEEIPGESTARHEAEQHWCSVHNTEFFKRGKMRSFAHPLADGKTWCHEGAKAEIPEPPKAEGTPAGAGSPPPDSGGTPPEAPPYGVTEDRIKTKGDLFTMAKTHLEIDRTAVLKKLNMADADAMIEKPWHYWLKLTGDQSRACSHIGPPERG